MGIAGFVGVGAEVVGVEVAEVEVRSWWIVMEGRADHASGVVGEDEAYADCKMWEAKRRINMDVD